VWTTYFLDPRQELVPCGTEFGKWATAVHAVARGRHSGKMLL